jgi:predicted nucleic acid-binding protein
MNQVVLIYNYKELNVKVYLDNCCFNRPFDNQTNLKIFLETQAKLYIQQKIIIKEYKFVWSYILEYENNHNPFEYKKEAIFQWKSLASEIIYENEEIILFAENLLEIGIKPKDALHISCAKYARCDYFFTTDKGILNKNIKEIKIINPVGFIENMEVE